MLLFKKRFLDAIRDGTKRQTIRLWKHRRYRTGQRSFIPGVGPIQITLVERVDLADLTDADAVADGFADAAALCAELESIYPDELAAGWQAWRVRFEVGEPPK